MSDHTSNHEKALRELGEPTDAPGISLYEDLYSPSSPSKAITYALLDIADAIRENPQPRFICMPNDMDAEQIQAIANALTKENQNEH